MAKTARTVVLVVAGLFGLGTLGTVGLVALFAFAMGDFGSNNSAWSEDAVAERDLPALFGLRLPVKPLGYHSRQLGFQDAYYEVLVSLPPGAAEQLLISNQLVRGARGPAPVELMELVRTLDPAAPQLEATDLDLLPALTADGGVSNLHRSGELLEGPGSFWLHLIAFEG